MHPRNLAMRSLDEVRWINLPSYNDSRGILTSVESNLDTPFTIRRIFYMHHTISSRGGHAHIETEQVIIASSGSFNIDISDGMRRKTYEMNDPTKGLYVPKMVFIKLYEFSIDAVCLVLASTHYDISKSIRSWDEYLKALKTESGSQ